MRKDIGLCRCLAVLGVMIISWWIGDARAAEGAPPSPYRSDLGLRGFYELTTSSNAKGEREIIPAVRLVGRLRTEGRIDARFTIRKNKTWKSSLRRAGTENVDPLNPVLLQGKVGVGGGYRRYGRRVMPAAASIIGKELKLTFPGRVRGSRKSRQRIFTIRVALDGSIRVSARIASIPVNSFKRGACAAPVAALASAGNQQGDEGGRVAAASFVAAEATDDSRRVLTISTDADPEWYAKYGDKSNAEIASIINAAEVIYDRQLGVRFQIVRQHVYTDTSPYDTTNAGRLLTAFVENAENRVNLAERGGDLDRDVDLKHLFTGRNLDGTVLGIAYIGVVCAAPNYSYGVTQSYLSSANAGIFAHEIGHNLGAFHDSSDPNGLMYPSIRVPPATAFSANTVGDIEYHFEHFGSCVSTQSVKTLPTLTVTPGPAPTPRATPKPVEDLEGGKLTIYTKEGGTPRTPLVRIYGRLRAADRTKVPNELLYLMSGDEPLAATTTNGVGVYQFFVRVSIRRGAQLGLYVRSEKGEVRTKTVYLSRTEMLRRRR